MKVMRESNWGHWDKLGGKELIDGETVKVTWPNKTKTTVKVIVKRSSYTVSDHGHPWECPVVEAYAAVHYKGLCMLAPLVGLHVERVLPKAKAKR